MNLPEPVYSQFVGHRFADCEPSLRNLARGGNVPAMMALGHIFFNGGAGIRRDFHQAEAWFKAVIAADRNAGFAAHRLGAIEYRGLVRHADHAAAFRWFRRAALGGYTKSWPMIATMLLEGDGAARKPRTAKRILICCVANRRLSLLMRALALVWLVVPIGQIWRHFRRDPG